MLGWMAITRCVDVRSSVLLLVCWRVPRFFFPTEDEAYRLFWDRCAVAFRARSPSEDAAPLDRYQRGPCQSREAEPFLFAAHRGVGGVRYGYAWFTSQQDDDVLDLWHQDTLHEQADAAFNQAEGEEEQDLAEEVPLKKNVPRFQHQHAVAPACRRWCRRPQHSVLSFGHVMNRSLVRTISKESAELATTTRTSLRLMRVLLRCRWSIS